MKIFLWLIILFPILAFGQLRPENGLKESTPAIIAFKNARIVVSPEKVIEHGTMVIKNDVITEIGMLVFIPDGAVVIDCKGRTIMPSFIEMSSSIGIPKVKEPTQGGRYPQLESLNKGAYYWNESIHPEFNAGEVFQADPKANEELHKMGYGFALTHQADGISRGTAAFVALGSGVTNKQVLSEKSAQVFSFEKGSSKQTYPSSQMGSIALLRQLFHDMEWYVQAKDKETNISLEKLSEARKLPYLFYTKDKYEILRAEKIAKEFSHNFTYVGSGNEYQALNQLKLMNAAVVLPINFPEAYDVKDPYVARQIPLSDLKHWEMAPSNPAILNKNQIMICLSSAGQKNADSFWKNLKKSMERGLSRNDALAALTTHPAKILGMEKELGTLEKGKKASFSIYESDPFESEVKVLETWILGERKVYEQAPLNYIAGKYNILIDGKRFPMEISAEKDKYSGKIQVVRQKTDPKKGVITKDTVTPKLAISLQGNDITIQFNIEYEEWNGSINLHGKVSSKFGVFEGDGMLPNGKWVQWSAIRSDKESTRKSDSLKIKLDTSYYQNLWFPHMAYGFDSLPAQETIVFKNATVWTNEGEGVLKNATVVSVNGKIAYVGTGNSNVTGKARVIDATGKHLTSGIIDEHSHIAISKGVNEGGQAISAEVSIRDVVNGDDIDIYRQLSGGVTAAQLLHGSANPIGGQSALIKLKWGSTPEEMLIKDAPKFIKFALGENVKQSNWGDFNTVRFPQTRMGVEQLYYDAFQRAMNYQKEWNDYLKTPIGVKPRKDLELDVLVEILNGNRFITCHSYIQSEINMLMHVADSLKFKINTFTHILEGYKVADKLAKHGAGASTFSDWWAYKYEVNDAIPYNAKVMSDLGIVVAINSDDAEMGRRLNQEAAKSVKYGGMSEEEAWKMVTLNPAKLLHLDDRMGSVKEGKDADLVLWTTNPLSIDAKVEMTIIDGTVIYDYQRDQLMRIKNAEERARIISKMLASNEKGEVSKPFFKKKPRHFHCDTLGEEGSTEENNH